MTVFTFIVDVDFLFDKFVIIVDLIVDGGFKLYLCMNFCVLFVFVGFLWMIFWCITIWSYVINNFRVFLSCFASFLCIVVVFVFVSVCIKILGLLNCIVFLLIFGFLMMYLMFIFDKMARRVVEFEFKIIVVDVFFNFFVIVFVFIVCVIVLFCLYVCVWMIYVYWCV